MSAPVKTLRMQEKDKLLEEKDFDYLDLQTSYQEFKINSTAQIEALRMRKNKIFEHKNAKHKQDNSKYLTVNPCTEAPWQQPLHWALPNYMMGAYVQQPKESLDSLDP